MRLSPTAHTDTDAGIRADAGVRPIRHTRRPAGRPRGLYFAAAVLAAASLGASLTGCQNVACDENRSSIPLAGFYSMATLKAVKVDSLRVGGVGAPGDTLLLRGGGSSVYLPLRATRPSTAFYFRYGSAQDAPADTLTMVYDAEPYFVSEECGASFRYRLRRLTHTRVLMDSVAVTAPDSVFTNVEAQTMRIYFRDADTATRVLTLPPL